MARPLRIEYPKAIYHVMSRGDAREPIFFEDADRKDFLHTLERTCHKTAWQVHAWCLMGNHFHLVIETPRPNLTSGMKWLLGTYTQRFNRRHQRWGHLFGGRYRAQLIDGRSASYLRAACDYVHLNPARAGLLNKDAKLESYSWSSYPAYCNPRLRPTWLRIDRLMGEHGLAQDNSQTRREFARRMRTARLDPAPGEAELVRRSWKLGAEDFVARLGEKLSRPLRAGDRARERTETDVALAERLVWEALQRVCWAEADLASQPKAHPVKVKIARQLRTQTPMTRDWIAKRLQMGSPSYLSKLLGSVDSKL
jgi:REP element-mobilizing transposase RayT